MKRPSATPWLDPTPALRTQLSLDAEALALALNEAQLDQLIAYLNLLVRWGKIYNLTAIRDPNQMLTHHFADCMAILPSLDEWLKPSVSKSVLDVGSGAGLPGVLIAVLRPQWTITCIDPVAKKAAFVRQVQAELGLKNLEVIQDRVESLDDSQLFDLAVSRAFASLGDFVRLAGPRVHASGSLVAMKGVLSADEMAETPAEWAITTITRLQVPRLEAERHLIVMRHQSLIPGKMNLNLPSLD